MSSVLLTRDITSAVNGGSNAANLIGTDVNTTTITTLTVDTTPTVDDTPDTGTTPAVDTTPDTDATANNVLDEITAASGISGGGCTIGGGAPDPLLSLLAAASVLFTFLRRHTRVKRQIKLVPGVR